MSRIETGKPLIRITDVQQGGGICPDIRLQFVAEPGNNYSFASGTFIQINLIDESGNPIQVTNYSNVGGTITVEIDSDTPIALNGTPLGDIVNWQPISVNVEKEDLSPAPLVGGSGLVGNILTAVVESDTNINVNSSPIGQIENWQTIEVDLEDSGGNPVIPTNINLTGNTLTLEVNAGITPAGVAFQKVDADQYTSYRTGDIGWRLQNGWYDFFNPPNPKAIAELDPAAGLNWWFVLKNPLVVGGVSSTVRFVDVDGLQVFPSANDKDLVVIDKLTGLMYTRTDLLDSTWNNFIDNALAYSIVVDGVTYDDWFGASLYELYSIYNRQSISTNSIIDSATSVTVLAPGGFPWSASTRRNSTTLAYIFRPFESFEQSENKGNTHRQIYVRKAYNLITAP
jgi:hypothetical protein